MKLYAVTKAWLLIHRVSIMTLYEWMNEWTWNSVKNIIELLSSLLHWMNKWTKIVLTCAEELLIEESYRKVECIAIFSTCHDIDWQHLKKNSWRLTHVKIDHNLSNFKLLGFHLHMALPPYTFGYQLKSFFTMKFTLEERFEADLPRRQFFCTTFPPNSFALVHEILSSTTFNGSWRAKAFTWIIATTAWLKIYKITVVVLKNLILFHFMFNLGRRIDNKTLSDNIVTTLSKNLIIKVTKVLIMLHDKFLSQGKFASNSEPESFTKAFHKFSSFHSEWKIFPHKSLRNIPTLCAYLK